MRTRLFAPALRLAALPGWFASFNQPAEGAEAVRHRREGKLPRLLLLCMAAALALASCPGCGGREEAVARIDGKSISKKALLRYLKRYRDASPGPASPTADSAATKQTPESAAAGTALQQLINEELLLFAAREQGLSSKKAESNPQQRQAAIRRMLSRLGREVPYPSLIEARKYYQQHRDEFKADTRYRIVHLLFSGELEARRVRAEVKRGKITLEEAGIKGLEGARIVGRESRPVSARELSPEIAKVLVKLKTGQISPVISTPYGYHLIRIIRRQPPGPIPFAEVENRIKDEIFARRLRNNYRKWLQQQRRAHTIEIFPEKLKNL